MRGKEPHSGTMYTHFLSKLCVLREAKLYLEVGVQNAVNLSQISVDTAVGVDPELNLTADPIRGKKSVHLYQMSSDAFFKSEHADRVLAGGVDLAFLDGMHLFEYLLRDFHNTEKHAAQNGLITLHDCLPYDGEMIERVFDYDRRTPGPNRGAWTGDVWKVVPILQDYRPDLCIHLINCFPTGLVVISNLDPQSRVLSENYLDITRKWRDVPNDENELEDFYSKQTIDDADRILDNHSHSLFFKL